MQIRQPLIAVAAVVAITVTLVVFAIPSGVGFLNGPDNGVNPHPLSEWFNTTFQGCCFGAGLNQSVVAPFPAVPNGTSVISIFGDVGVTTWERVADRLITEVGQCANSFSPPGACNVYVGIWAPAAWSAYVAGGPLDPLWCYSAGATCLNFSGGSLSSPNLQTLDGVHGEIVIWNLAPYQLVGQYEVDIYTSVPG
jgi:hypothetical protein